MRLVIQRVKEASVKADGEILGQIQRGMVVLLGVRKHDSQKDVEYLVNKIAHLRMFEDDNGKMNLSAAEVNAQFLIVSQFTLLGNCEKGRRPSFDNAAEPKLAEELYNRFIEQLKSKNFEVAGGKFAAMMDVSLVNNGPVTFVLDS